MHMANDTINTLPSLKQTDGKSPMSIFANTIVLPNARHWHHFGCPVYVLAEAGQTGMVSPQFHVSFDDAFQTVRPSYGEPMSLSHWQHKAGFVDSPAPIRKDFLSATNEAPTSAYSEGEVLPMEPLTPILMPAGHWSTFPVTEMIEGDSSPNSPLSPSSGCGPCPSSWKWR
jgi:hypothetical protein